MLHSRKLFEAVARVLSCEMCASRRNSRTNADRRMRMQKRRLDEACSLTNPYQSDLKRFVLRKVSSSKHVPVETLQPTLCAPETVAWSPIQAPRTIAFTYWHNAKFITNSRKCHVIWSEAYAGLVPGQLFGIII